MTRLYRRLFTTFLLYFVDLIRGTGPEINKKLHISETNSTASSCSNQQIKQRALSLFIYVRTETWARCHLWRRTETWAARHLLTQVRLKICSAAGRRHDVARPMRPKQCTAVYSVRVWIVGFSKEKYRNQDSSIFMYCLCVWNTRFEQSFPMESFLHPCILKERKHPV